MRRFLAAKVIWWCGLIRKAAPSRRGPQVTATAGEKTAGSVTTRPQPTPPATEARAREGRGALIACCGTCINDLADFAIVPAGGERGCTNGGIRLPAPTKSSELLANRKLFGFDGISPPCGKSSGPFAGDGKLGNNDAGAFAMCALVQRRAHHSRDIPISTWVGPQTFRL